MNASTLWYIFLGNLAALWLFLGLSTAIMFNRDRLRNKGHDAEAIEFLKRDNRTRCLGIAIVMPLVELLAAAVVFLWFVEISTHDHFLYICMIAVAIIIPFPILDFFQTRKKQKALVVNGGKKVVIDMNHRVWHLVFRPGWEALATLFLISYFVWQGSYFNLAMMHLAILWLLYLAGRGGRFLTGPSLSDLYQGNFLFMVINHLLILLHLVRFVTHCCPVAGEPNHTIGLLLICLLSLKLVYYFIRLPQFRRELSKLTESETPA